VYKHKHKERGAHKKSGVRFPATVYVLEKKGSCVETERDRERGDTQEYAGHKLTLKKTLRNLPLSRGSS